MKKIVIGIILLLFSLGVIVVWQYIRFNDGKMHVVFCDVGQGDAVLIKTPNNKYILYDGGPDRKVTNCLADHMPFWQRQIDLLLLSHPHADHFFGMFYVLERYHVKAFATEELANKTQAYEELLKIIQQKHIPQTYVSAGDAWDIGDVSIHAVGPTEKYLNQTSPGGTIGESKEFASLVLQIGYGTFSVLLTGDSQVAGLEDSLDGMDRSPTVLQVPHHGSASGLDSDILEKLGPAFAVISVGADNRYKHPNPQILDLLQSLQIPFLRTDQKGDIEFISDGENWTKRSAK